MRTLFLKVGVTASVFVVKSFRISLMSICGVGFNREQLILRLRF